MGKPFRQSETLDNGVVTNGGLNSTRGFTKATILANPALGVTPKGGDDNEDEDTHQLECLLSRLIIPG